MNGKNLVAFALAFGVSCAVMAAIDQELVFQLAVGGGDQAAAHYPIGETSFRHPDGSVFATASTENDGSTTFRGPDGAIIASAVSAYAVADRNGNKAIRDMNGNITAILPTKGALGDRELKSLATAPVDHTNTAFRAPDGTVLATALTDHGGKTSFRRVDGAVVATAASGDDHGRTSFRGPDGKLLATALATDNGQTIFRSPKGEITAIVTTAGPIPLPPPMPPTIIDNRRIIYVTNERELLPPPHDGGRHHEPKLNIRESGPGGKKLDIRAAYTKPPLPDSKKLDIRAAYAKPPLPPAAGADSGRAGDQAKTGKKLK